uniref:Uncharacterized protein n=1 Tax=Avena sativa TaxID=4498 RepID=A0ACD5U590_AVESA
MDEFKVEIDVQSFLTIVDGRRIYTRGKTWGFMFGRNLSVEHIKAAVEEKFRWSDDQRMTIWYGTGHTTVPLISESEIAELFDACSGTKIVRFGVTIESKQQHNEHVHVLVMAEDDDDQPVRAPFFAWPKQAYAWEYEDDEQIGCDGESTYLQKENDGSNENSKPQNNAEPEVISTRVPLGTLDVDNSYDPQHAKGDDESLLGNNLCPTYLHDKSNPRIAVGATFPDSKAFKVALRQLAIREDWSFDTEYSDPQRFRAKCTDKDCPWRIHASKIKDTKILMVPFIAIFCHFIVIYRQGLSTHNALVDIVGQEASLWPYLWEC